MCVCFTDYVYITCLHGLHAIKAIVVRITVIYKYILDEVLAASDEKAKNKKIKQ